jgi:hypothetical protein
LKGGKETEDRMEGLIEGRIEASTILVPDFGLGPKMKEVFRLPHL